MSILQENWSYSWWMFIHKAINARWPNSQPHYLRSWIILRLANGPCNLLLCHLEHVQPLSSVALWRIWWDHHRWQYKDSNISHIGSYFYHQLPIFTYLMSYVHLVCNVTFFCLTILWLQQDFNWIPSIFFCCERSSYGGSTLASGIRIMFMSGLAWKKYLHHWNKQWLV